MNNFMKQNLETANFFDTLEGVEKHEMTIEELLFLQNLQKDLQKAEITCFGDGAIATYYVLEEQVRRYIDPFFGHKEHQPEGFEFRIQGSEKDRIIDDFGELYRYLDQEIQNSEYADRCRGLFLRIGDCPYLDKITMIDQYGHRINFAQMLSWYEIIAKEKFDFEAFYCRDSFLRKEIFLTRKDAKDYVLANFPSKENCIQIKKVERPISGRMVKLFQILSSVDFAALASLH